MGPCGACQPIVPEIHVLGHTASHLIGNDTHSEDWPYQAKQHARREAVTAPFTVLRLLTPLKMTYEAAKQRAMPYDKIVGELPATREETVTLVNEAVRQKVRVYALVNNRAEGNAPLAIHALVDQLSATR